MRFLLICVISILLLLGETGHVQPSGIEEKPFYRCVFPAPGVVTEEGSSLTLAFGREGEVGLTPELEGSADSGSLFFPQSGSGGGSGFAIAIHD